MNKIKLAECDSCNETAEMSDKAHHENLLMNFRKKRNAMSKIEETSTYQRNQD